MRTTQLALPLGLLALLCAAPAHAQQAAQPLIIVSSSAPPAATVPPAALEQPVSRRGSVVGRVLPPSLGAGLLGIGWLTTWVGTIAWYADTTHCSSGGFLGIGRTCSHDGPNDDALGASFIPIVGPWIMLNTPDVDPLFPAIMGITQAAGVLTLAIGIPLGRMDRDDEVAVDVRASPGSAELVVSGRF